MCAQQCVEWPEAFANSWVRRQITLDAMDWTTKGVLTPVKNQGSVARVGRDHGLLQRCMVPRHRQRVTSERAEARGLTRSIPVVTVCSWTTACFRQEEYHAHGDHLQLHRSKGHLQSLCYTVWDRTGKSHGMHGRIH